MAFMLKSQEFASLLHGLSKHHRTQLWGLCPEGTAGLFSLQHLMTQLFWGPAQQSDIGLWTGCLFREPEGCNMNSVAGLGCADRSGI